MRDRLMSIRPIGHCRSRGEFQPERGERLLRLQQCEVMSFRDCGDTLVLQTQKENLDHQESQRNGRDPSLGQRMLSNDDRGVQADPVVSSHLGVGGSSKDDERLLRGLRSTNPMRLRMQ